MLASIQLGAFWIGGLQGLGAFGFGIYGIGGWGFAWFVLLFGGFGICRVEGLGVRFPERLLRTTGGSVLNTVRLAAQLKGLNDRAAFSILLLCVWCI